MADRDEVLDASKAFLKVADIPPPQSADERAYWAQVDQIVRAARKAAIEAFGSYDDATVVKMLGCMLHAAYIEQARLNALLSPGFTRSGRFAVRDLKPKPRMVDE